MPALKRKPYVQTYEYTWSLRQKTRHKTVDSTIKQLTRPIATIRRKVNKNDLILQWVEQDLVIVDRDRKNEQKKKKPDAELIKRLNNAEASLQAQLPLAQAAVAQSSGNAGTPRTPKKPAKKKKKGPKQSGGGGGGGGSEDDDSDDGSDYDPDEGNGGPEVYNGSGTVPGQPRSSYANNEKESEPESDVEPVEPVEPVESQGNNYDPFDWIMDVLPQPMNHPPKRYRRTVAIFNPKDLPENASMDRMHRLEQDLYN